MAEVSFNPKTGFAVSKHPDNHKWGVVESRFFGITQVADADLTGKDIKDLKVDLTKLSAKDKADLADPQKKLRKPVALIEKTKAEKEIK